MSQVKAVVLQQSCVFS